MKGFGNLMDIAQAKELQKLEAAQREQQKLYAMNEKRSVELKYGHCEKNSSFKDPIRKEIECKACLNSSERSSTLCV